MDWRREAMREMNLLPLWRQRVALGGAEEQLAPVAPMPASAPAASDRESEIAALSWEDLSRHIAACTACGLCRSRQRSVPGVGGQTAEWLVVGEAPGEEEDRKGEPFVGQAGKLLDSMLAAIGLKRGEAVYIANVLKCRPPGNRKPAPEEVSACRPYLDRQIALLKPRIILALGSVASLTLLNADTSVARLRGRVHQRQGIPLVVTYHPSYLLRSLPEKAKAWDDLCLARETCRHL